MQNMRARTFVIGLTASIGVLIVGGILWVFFGPPGEQQQEAGPAPDYRRLLRLKNTGLGNLENGNYDESDAAFAEIARELPDDPLGPRNLLISRLLELESTPQERGAEDGEFSEVRRKARSALSLVQETDSESPVVHLLAGELATRAGDDDKAFREFVAASGADADNAVAWFNVYLTGQDSDDPQMRQQAQQALARAYELQPDNLFVLAEYLVAQAQAENPQIAETLEQARRPLQPFVETIRRQRRFDLTEAVDKAVAAAEQGEWPIVLRNVRIIRNFLRPEVASHIDRSRIDPHPLEYVLREFESGFYERAELPEESDASALPVTLAPAPAERRLPDMANVHHAVPADFDLDGRLEVIALRDGSIEVYGRNDDASGWTRALATEVSAEMSGLLIADLDRDTDESPNAGAGHGAGQAQEENGTEKTGARRMTSSCLDADVDLVVWGAGGVDLLKNAYDPEQDRRTLEPVPQDDEFKQMRDVLAVAAADVDHDGDLDLAVSTKAGLRLWSNRDNFTFEEITGRSMLPPAEMTPERLLPVDFNRDVATDILACGPSVEPAGFLENILHARFRWREFDEGFDGLAAANDLALLDADGNVSWDLAAAGPQGINLVLTRTRGSVVRALESKTLAETPADGLRTWDYDNDGFQDLLAWGADGLTALRGGPDGSFEKADALFDSPPQQVQTCEVGDVDDDGDQDVFVVTEDGLRWYVNEGGNENHWLDVALRAEQSAQNPSQRCPIHGVGSLLELKAGPRYQAHIVRGRTTHFGLGDRERADVLRVLWTNGIPHNILEPAPDQVLCEEQTLKGSCPYLYTWDGEGYAFHTDLLWSAPLGLQRAEGVLAPAREWEYLRIPAEKLAARDGEYHLQITEELWEAAYFDQVELLAVDHPADVEVYSNEKVGPAEVAEFRVHTVRNPRRPVAARDSRGRDVLPLIAERDDTYVRPFARKLKQGLTETHSLELDLGELQDPRQIRLFLTGWIRPTDTSLNIAISQNPDVDAPRPPAIQVPDQDGNWGEVIPYTGFPGGKTKTIAVDLSDAFLTDDYRVRIVTSMELYWDHVFFTVDESAGEHRLREMPLLEADLHYRGFSRRIPHPGHGPEDYDYSDVSADPRWPPMRGRFTRFGNVTPLLEDSDARMVVMGAGDEMTLRFRADEDDLPPGWTRDFLLHNVGWDKDADLNTVTGQAVEPLPFAEMKRYPYGPEGGYPRTPAHEEYLRTYQTRRLDAAGFWRHVRRSAGGRSAE